jgi:hypothetical protein
MSRRFGRNKKLKRFPSRRIATTNRPAGRKGFTMKYLRYVALLALLALPLAYSQAEVRVGVGVGFGGYVAGPPVCAYGYYPDYPYSCAPYGYYGPSWFANGIFIGAGPWYGWGHPYYGRGYYGRGFDGRFEGRRSEGRGFDGHGFDRHGPAVRGGFEGRGSVGSSRGGFHRGSRGGR